jgi:hypothetical protein
MVHIANVASDLTRPEQSVGGFFYSNRTVAKSRSPNLPLSPSDASELNTVRPRVRLKSASQWPGRTYLTLSGVNSSRTISLSSFAVPSGIGEPLAYP